MRDGYKLSSLPWWDLTDPGCASITDDAPLSPSGSRNHKSYFNTTRRKDKKTYHTSVAEILHEVLNTDLRNFYSNELARS